MAIAPRVILLASRNGKVIFPSWLRPGTLFLGKASTGRNYGPCSGPVPEARRTGFFFSNGGERWLDLSRSRGKGRW
jgi:hypothetical protein